MSTERRTYERKLASVRIAFRCCEKGCEGVSSNISGGGMFIKTGEKCVPAHTPFDVFYTANGRTLQIPVRLSRLVTGDRDYGLGISFIRAS